MRPILFTHDSAQKHQVPEGHPERPERMQALSPILAERATTWHSETAPEAGHEQLQLVHPDSYLHWVYEQAANVQDADKPVNLDPDTWIGPDSLTAARCGVGATCAGVDRLMTGKSVRVFSAMRPPGHHAEPDKAMGFCLFSNAAIGAEYARKTYGLTRVAVLDFDVHHGNGTQAAFYGDGDLYYASTHQMPLYPGTGAADERGYGNIFNYPLAAGAGGTEFLSGWRDVLLPAMLAAQPELIIISAGFDAHRADPLATLNVNTADFATLTDDIIRLAEETSEGRILSLLEGGYDLTALADSCAVHLDRLSA